MGMHGKYHSEETKKKQSLAHLGKPKSKEQKIKQSKTMRLLYEEGKITSARYWKDKVFSEEHKDKLRNAHLNKPCPQRGVKGNKNYFFGKSKKGELNPMYGRKQSEETKQKIREKRLGKRWNEESLNKMKKTFEDKMIHKGEKNPFYGKKHSPECIEKHIQRFTAENNPRWIDGRSFIPYTSEFNTQFKKTIKERDNYICLRCYITEKETKNKYKQGLHIHHIDFNKLNTYKENCCSLCIRCNMQVNTNRDYWTKFFQNLLSEKYGYVYPLEIKAQQLNILKNINYKTIK